MQSLAFTATYGVMSTGSCCWKIRLTGKDFDEHPASVITPYDSHVADVWSAAYLVISNANMVINALKPLTAPMSVPLTSTRRKP